MNIIAIFSVFFAISITANHLNIKLNSLSEQEQNLELAE